MEKRGVQNEKQKKKKKTTPDVRSLSLKDCTVEGCSSDPVTMPAELYLRTVAGCNPQHLKNQDIDRCSYR